MIELKLINIYIYACVYMYITYNVKYQMNNIKYFMIEL